MWHLWKMYFVFAISFIAFLTEVRSSQENLENVTTDYKYLRKFPPRDSDFLTENPYIYIPIVIGLFVGQIVILLLMGQNCIFKEGLRCWNGNPYGPENSQQIADWYTLTHIVHGFLMYFAILLLLWLWPVIPFALEGFGFLIALITAVAWELIENTPCVINRFRQTGVAAGYVGDSVTNAFCDSVAMSVGYWFAYFVPWYTIAVLILAEEIILALVIRDNFILNVTQLMYPFKCISDWQEKGNPSNGDNDNGNGNPQRGGVVPNTEV